MTPSNPRAPDTPLLTPRTISILKLSIIAMTALIIAGIVALFIGLQRQAGILFAKSPIVDEQRYSLPQGTNYKSFAPGDNGGLWLEVVDRAGHVSLIFLRPDGSPVKILHLDKGDKR